MANGLRDFLFAAVMGERRLSVVAGRFDAALNNMPQGLLMFDAGQRIAVVNNKVRTLLNADENTRIRGRTLEVLLRYCVRNGVFPHNDLNNIRARMQDLLNGRKTRDIFQLGDDRYIECIGNRTSESGAVV